MVWGGISRGGKTDPVFIEGNLTARRYIDEVLEPMVVPYAGAIGQDFILQDDNARPHRAGIVRNFLDGEGIERMEWPALSPDLNHGSEQTSASPFRPSNSSVMPLTMT